MLVLVRPRATSCLTSVCRAALGHESVTTLQSYAKAGAGTSARQQKVLTVLSGGKEGREHAA